MNKKIKVKLFIKILITVILVFIFYHLAVWNFYTSKIFGLDKNIYVGDLARVSYQIDLLDSRESYYNLEKKHFHADNYNNNEPIDMLTIGDSFSHGGAGGKNSYYQDYLATNLDLNVLNLKGLKHSAYLFETILILLNNGELEKLKPKVILIESVSRFALSRFSKDFDFDIEKSEITIESQIIKKQHIPYIPPLLQINVANYKVPYYLIRSNFYTKVHPLIHRLQLKKKLFNIDKGNFLLFHNEDIIAANTNAAISMKKLNENFNKLAIKLKELNIKLFFMPIVDKYDLYYDYIIDNPYNKNNFFDELRELKKEYYFVDTKKVLLQEVKNKKRDIFYADDAHWSYKASEAISKDKVFDILKK